MKVFLLWLFLFPYCSTGSISIPGVSQIKDLISEWTKNKLQRQLQNEICDEKNIDTLLNEDECKEDQACLDQLPQIKEQLMSECSSHLENPQKKPVVPQELSGEQRQLTTQEQNQPDKHKNNSQPETQQKGNNIIIKLQPIKLSHF